MVAAILQRFLRTAMGVALAVSLLLSVPLVGFSDVVDQMYWNKIFAVEARQAPPSVVMISVNEPADVSASAAAHFIDILARQMPSRVYIDVPLPQGLDPQGDSALQQALARFGPDVTFVSRSMDLNRVDAAGFHWPPKAVVGQHAVVISTWFDNAFHSAQSTPAALTFDGRVYPSMGADLAMAQGVQVNPDLLSSKGRIYPDFSVDPASITRIPARALLGDHITPGSLTGRIVVVSATSGVSPIRYFGHGLQPPLALDIAAAAAMRLPYQLDGGFLPLLVLATILTWCGVRLRDGPLPYYVAYVLAVGAVVLAPVGLRSLGIVLDPGAAILFLVVFGAVRLWQRRLRRVQLTSAAGLPNLQAFSDQVLPPGRDVIVAVVARYEEILATLPRELHADCANQIARRLRVDNRTGPIIRPVYHSDAGVFVWTEQACPLDVQLANLEGVRALFSSPLIVGPHTFDTNIHFGLDRNEGAEPLTRVNSALASANQAMASGHVVEVFAAERMTDMPWQLSLHAQIDDGLRRGDIWMAYQMQWDFRHQRISGAEALIRWSHPERGFIAPDAFIVQAERAGRIDALTYWVLDQAIQVALYVNALGPRFQMSINLSAQMVDKPDLVGNFRDIIGRHGIDPRLLTVEITETASVGNRTAAGCNLTSLRQLGCRLSIDDFGTGEASLAALADLPSDELKLDRRFIAKLLTGQRERAIVISAIGLAHALGQDVVAEGIEDEATFAALAGLGCDFAQGYYLSRPQRFEAFLREYEDRLRRCGRAV